MAALRYAIPPDASPVLCCEQCCIPADTLLLQGHPQLLLDGQHQGSHTGAIIQLRDAQQQFGSSV
jgi:hypothetical protein